MTFFSVVDTMEEASRRVDSGDAVQPPKLPFELLHLVAQHAISIATEEKDTKAMKTFSLVFSGWRILFQRALFKIKVPYLQFSEFRAMIDERSPISELRDLLDANPDFQQAITSLSLRVLGTGTNRGAAPDFTASLLSQLRSVDTVRISHAQPPRRSHSWASLSDEVQGALIALFHSPSLRYLDIPWFDAPLAITFPEGAERDTVKISCRRSPDLQRDHLFDGSGLHDWDATQSLSLRPCIVRHLISVPPIASKLLRATRPSKTGRTPFIDSSTIYSVDMTMEDHGELQDLRAVLHRTNNLQNLIVHARGMDGLFQEPQPGCLVNLKEIDLTFNWISESESFIKVIIRELSVYPPKNVLKNVIMKITSFKRVFVPPLVEKLRDELVALADLLGNTSRFPLLECVEVIPELGMGDLLDWARGRGANNVAHLAKILEEVMMEVQKMGFGFKFNVHMSEKDIASLVSRD